MKEWKTTLFCGSFEGETDMLSRIDGLKVYNTGIGLHDSLYSLQRYLMKNQDIKTVLFFGSAGAYPHSELKVGNIVYSYKFLSKDLAEIKNMCKVPEIMTRHILTQVDPRTADMAEKLGFKEVITNSMNYVTLVNLSSEELVNSLFDVGAENMEAFSLAYAASRLSVNFTAFYYITNIVGENGSKDWAIHWREGSNILQKKIINYIKGK